MTNSLLLFSLLLVLSGPKFKFEEKKHDFGKKAFRSKVEYSFNFTNAGDAPLIIESHETSCHCTSAIYPQYPIQPGETDAIVVKYDATKVGVFYRKVVVKTNAGKETLVIKGEILKGGKVNPLTGE